MHETLVVRALCIIHTPKGLWVAEAIVGGGLLNYPRSRRKLIMKKTTNWLRKKYKNHIFLFRVAVVCLVIVFGVGVGTAVAFYTENKTPMQSANSSKSSANSQSSTICIAGAPGCKTKSTTTTTPAPPAASTPATSTQQVPQAQVPQSVSNNQQLALMCSQAQGSYDQLTVSALNQEESGINNIKSQTSLSTSDMYAQENQVNETYFITVTQEYAGYLKQVQAIPGCAVDFTEPTPFPVLATN